MNPGSTRHVLIIGNGITGATVARHLRKRGDDRITMVSGESAYPFSRPALMYVFMGDLTFEDTKLYEDGFWDKNRIALRQGWVEELDTAGRCALLRDGVRIPYDELVIATGSRPSRFGWPGQDLTGVQSLYHWQDVELLEKHAARARRAVLCGGGLIGIELAEMLLSRGIAVTFLVRESRFWGSVLPPEEAALIERHIIAHGVDLRLGTELREILPDDGGRARAAVTGGGEEIACEIVGLTAGVSPDISLAKRAGIECARGVLVDPFFRTATTGVWAGGDCAELREVPPGRRAIEPVWYAGKIHGEHIAANLCGDHRPYRPGVWFNSAKFFDIEYQTYGAVPREAGPGVGTFYWEDAAGARALRVNFERDTGAVLGANVLGIRHRNAVWETWIRSRAAIGEVMENLGAANFDPEFFQRAEPAIVAAFNARHPERAVSLKTGRGLFSAYLRDFFRKPLPDTARA